MGKIELKPYLVRFAIVTAISLVLVIAISEGAFLLQKDKAENRPPKTITLVIPAGTADKIATGEEVPGIPTEMNFILGDVLEVRNEDNTTHRLGPLYIPAHSTGSLPMGEADNFSVSCSFQPTNYLGFDVREPTTIWTRLLAMLAAGPPTILFFYLNSLLVFPIKSEKEKMMGKGKDKPEADKTSL